MLQGIIAKGESAELTGHGADRCADARNVRGAQGAHCLTSPSCLFRLMLGEDVGDYTIDLVSAAK